MSPFELGDVEATAARYVERTAGLDRDLETLRAMFHDVHVGQHPNRDAQLQALSSARYALDEQIAERKRFHAQWRLDREHKAGR
jgi:hypothetical protein